MQISLMTYNLLYSQALKQIDRVILKSHPDIITLQEIETTDENLKKIEKLGYKLADYSNSFFKHQKIYGIATFYNPDKITFKQSTSFNLSRGIYEILLFLLRGGNSPRTVLTTKFMTNSQNIDFNVYNLHLTTWGTNGVRMKQIKETLQTLEIKTNPCIIAGDFNFSYGRKQFERLFDKYNLKEATDNIMYTLESRFLKIIPVRLKLDYILYQNLKLLKTEKINIAISDHFPIISTFEV